MVELQFAEMHACHIATCGEIDMIASSWFGCYQSTSFDVSPVVR